MLENGLRELIISGINLRQYQSREHDFWDLLAFLDRELSREWGETARLRCSSLDPAQLDERGLETIAACRMLCPHLHLSIQSASPTVLRRMGRSHNKPGMVARGVEQLQQYFPRLGVGADLLVGFPGESDEEFQETFDFVQTPAPHLCPRVPLLPPPGHARCQVFGPGPQAGAYGACGQVAGTRQEQTPGLCPGPRTAAPPPRVAGVDLPTRGAMRILRYVPPGRTNLSPCREPGHVIVDVAPTGADGDILVVRSLEPRS